MKNKDFKALLVYTLMTVAIIIWVMVAYEQLPAYFIIVGAILIIVFFVIVIRFLAKK